MSALFQDLYRRATIREHALLLRRGMLRQSLGDSSGPMAITRLAASLLSLDEEFETNMRAVAERMRMRVRRDRYMCPVCGQSNCPGAAQVIALPANMQHLVQHLLAGGEGYEYEE